MYKLYRLVIKNFKLLIRSRISGLIIIIGPLLVIFLAGLAFNNHNIYNIKVGIFTKNYTKDVQSIADELSKKNFKVYREENEEAGIYDIRNGKINTFIVFPDNANFNDISGKCEITYYIDNSRMNIVYMVMDAISSRINSASIQVSEDITGLILYRTEEVRKEINADEVVTGDLVLLIDDCLYNINNNSYYYNQDEKHSEKIDRLSIVTEYDIPEKLVKVYRNIPEAVDKITSSIDYIISWSQTNDPERLRMSLLPMIQPSLLAFGDAQADLNVIDGIAKKELPVIKKESVEIILNIQKAKDELEISGTSLQNINLKSSRIKDSLSKMDKSFGEYDVTDASNIASPFKTVIKPVTKEDTYLNYLLPSIIVLIVMFVSILLATTLVMLEKHTPAYFRNSIIPVPTFHFVTSILITTFIILSIQIFIILAIAEYFFQAKITANASNIVPAIFILSCTFVFIGMAIGYLFTSEETGTLAAISVGSACMLISDLILPLESMPDSVLAIARFNPFILGQVMLKRTILFKSALQSISWELKILIAYSAVFFAVIYVSQVLTRNYFFRRVFMRFRINIR